MASAFRRELIVLLLLVVEAGDVSANRWAQLYNRALQQFNRGDFDSSGKTVEPAWQTWQGAAGSEWYWPFRLLLAESRIEQDRLKEATPLLAGAAPSAAWEARRLVGLAFIQYRERNHGEARRALDSAETINPPSARDVAGKIELIRGTMYLREEQPALAEACFRRAFESVAGTGSLVESYTLTSLGVGNLRAFRADEAVVWFERARALAQRSGMQRGVILAGLNLGVGYGLLGDLDRATRYLDEAASIAGGLGDQVNLLRVLVTAGEAAFELGDHVKAEKYLQEARRLTSPGRDDEWLVTILADLSTMALAQGNLAAAARFNHEAADVAIRLPEPRPRLAQKIQAAEIAAASHDDVGAKKLLDDARVAAQELGYPFWIWQCHAGLASLHRRAGRIPEAEREYRSAIGVIEGERSRLSEDEFKLSFLSYLIRFYGDYVDFLIDRGDPAGAFRVAQSSRARLLSEKQHRTGSKEPAVDLPTLEDKVRRSGSVVLSYWLAPRRSFVWVVGGAKLELVTLPPEPEIAARVNRYSGAIRNGQNPLESGDADGRWLYSNILPAVVRERKHGRIVIEPDGALHQLNFESLPVQQGNHYWIEDATISIAPSLALLSEPAKVPQRRLLLFGDPDFGNSPDLPPLPNLKAEMDGVSKHYPDKAIFTRASATPTSYGGAHPENYSTLHFATHAIANRESPLDSAIILAGPESSRKLYARDILRQPLAADLVTLSACQTAGSRTYYGEGLMGFSWAFLSAGARNVVAGLWQVDDRATARLMERFYEVLAEGYPPADALRQAKLELVASDGAYRKPRYWAAFETFTRALYR
jgi:tetratricopeptide (TPR) repeat protein